MSTKDSLAIYRPFIKITLCLLTLFFVKAADAGEQTNYFRLEEQYYISNQPAVPSDFGVYSAKCFRPWAPMKAEYTIFAGVPAADKSTKTIVTPLHELKVDAELLTCEERKIFSVEITSSKKHFVIESLNYKNALRVYGVNDDGSYASWNASFKKTPQGKILVEIWERFLDAVCELEKIEDKQECPFDFGIAQ